MNQTQLEELFREKFDTWYEPLKEFIHTEEFLKIGTQVNIRSNQTIVYPKKPDIFKAFKDTSWNETRVVILGESPYCTPKYASGLAFGVSHDLINSLNPFPPLLENIATEVEQDLYDGLNFIDYTLEHWSEQGVLMLNTALTVEENKPGSHKILWKPFIEYVVKTISENKPGTIWLLWGDNAKSYKTFINSETNHILESGSPSPLSANKGTWFGNKHFSKTNEILEAANGPEFKIKW